MKCRENSNRYPIISDCVQMNRANYDDYWVKRPSLTIGQILWKPPDSSFMVKLNMFNEAKVI